MSNIPDKPIISVKMQYDNGDITALLVKFIDQTTDVYVSKADMKEIFHRIDKQKEALKLTTFTIPN